MVSSIVQFKKSTTICYPTALRQCASQDSFPPDSEAAASRHSLLGLRRLSLPAAAVAERLRSSSDGFPLRRLTASEEFPPSASSDTHPADNRSNTSTAMLSASAPTTAAAASAEAWRTFHRQSIRQALSQQEQIEHTDRPHHHLPHLHRYPLPLKCSCSTKLLNPTAILYRQLACCCIETTMKVHTDPSQADADKRSTSSLTRLNSISKVSIG